MRAIDQTKEKEFKKKVIQLMRLKSIRPNYHSA